MSARWIVLGLLAMLSLITYLDRVCIAIAGPRIQEELDISPQGWGWILGVFSVAYGLFEIPSGALGDRFGQRKVLTRIVTWWSTFTILTGLVTSFSGLLATRFLFGAGEAGAFPNMASAIGQRFPKSQRARTQGGLWAASRVGGAISPFLVVPLMAAWGWRAPFIIFGLVGVVWALVWHTWYRDRSPVADANPEHSGAPWRVFFRSRQFWLIIAMAWCYGWGASFYLSWLYAFLIEGRGLNDADTQRYAALPFLLGMVGNLVGGVLSDRLSSRYGLRTGRQLVGSTSLALSALMLFIAALTADVRIGVGAIGLGYGIMDCMLPSNWANCIDIGGRFAGSVSGAMNTAVQAGGFISIVLFGYMVEKFGSYDAPLCVIAAMLVVSAVLFSRIDPTRPLVANATCA
jgi:MFS transporter, ACS family, glucarate transporter